MDDRSLLDRFLSSRDDQAFRELVGRHLDFVHGVARRVTGNDDLARDAAQTVFAKLARDGAKMPRGLSLAAWLHRTTRCAAVDLVRAEDRRRRREQLAHSLMDPTPEPEWERLAPVIDEVIDTLPAADRELVLSKYYRNETFAGIAARLGWTEANARKRASRALEKLRSLLSRRGVTTTAVALAAVLPAHAVTPAPASLAATVLTAAGAPAPSIGFSLAMTTAQKSTTAAAAAIVLLASGWTGHAIGSSQARAMSAPVPPPTSLSMGEDRTEAGGRRTKAEPAGLSFERLLAGEDRRTWAVVSRLNAADVPVWLEKLRAYRTSVAANSAEDDRLAEIESALYFHWATADPHAAWAAAAALPESQDFLLQRRTKAVVQSVLAAWMRRDADEAYAVAKYHPEYGYVARDMLVLTWTTGSLEENLAKHPDKRRDLLGWFCGSVAGDPHAREEALAYLLRKPEPKDADWGRMLLFRSWGYDDFDAAVAKAEALKLPDMIGLVYQDNLRMNPHRVMPWAIANGVPPGGPDWEEGYGEWLGRDREAAQSWFAEQAESWETQGHDAAVAGFLSADMAASEWPGKDGQRDAALEEAAARRLGDFLERWRKKDAKAEEKWFSAASKETRDRLIQIGTRP